MFTPVGFNEQDIVKDGLVLWYDANDKTSYPGSGTTWRDLSKLGNNGTLTNGPTYSSTNGGSIVFDGADDNVQLGNASNIITNTSAISAEAWVKTNVVGAYKKILVGVNVGTQTINNVYFSIGPSPFNLYFGVATNLAQSAAVYGSDISTTQYSHLLGTWDGTTIRLYVNGNFVSFQAIGGTMFTTGIMRISGYDNGSEIWNGNIASVKIYNRALNATEVKQNYNALKPRFGL